MPGPLFWLYLPQHLALNVAALVFYPLRGQGRAVWRAKRDALLGLSDRARAAPARCSSGGVVPTGARCATPWCAASPRRIVAVTVSPSGGELLIARAIEPIE